MTWREVLPLGLFFWGERWLLVAWCELRNDYRNFSPRPLSGGQKDRTSIQRVRRPLVKRFSAQDPVRGAGEIKKARAAGAAARALSCCISNQKL
ncbi:Transcriptional regulator, DeoR family [Klebsiella pneumoniae ISC21]|nr:Transcriptional regulator, DeoR family [Klebsiella pneumoniae ISC21]